MEENDSLWRPFRDSIGTFVSIGGVKEEQERQRIELGSAEAEYKTHIKELQQAVLDHPSLTPIQKVAWHAAIKRNQDDPVEFESSADHITMMLETLDQALSQEGAPVALLLENGRSIEIFRSLGQGVEFIEGDYSRVRTKGIPSTFSDVHYWLHIWPEQTAGVAASADTVDNLDLEQILDKPSHAGSETLIIVGEEAIARLIDNLYDLPGNISKRPIERLLTEAERMDFKVEQLSDRVRQTLELKRNTEANIIAKDFFNLAAQGYESDASLDRIEYAASNKGVPMDLVTEHIRRIRNERFESTDKWLAELEAGLQRQSEPSEPATASE